MFSIMKYGNKNMIAYCGEYHIFQLIEKLGMTDVDVGGKKIWFMRH